MAQSSRSSLHQVDSPMQGQPFIDLTNIDTEDSEYASQPASLYNPSQPDQISSRGQTPQPQNPAKKSPAGQQHRRARKKGHVSDSEHGSAPSEAASSLPAQSCLCMKATPFVVIDTLVGGNSDWVAPVLAQCPRTRLGKSMWKYLLYLRRNLGELMPRAQPTPHPAAGEHEAWGRPAADLAQQTYFLQQRGEFLNRAFNGFSGVLEGVCDRSRSGVEVDLVRREEIRRLHIPMCVAILKAVFEAASTDGGDDAHSEGQEGGKRGGNSGDAGDGARMVTFSKMTLIILTRVCDWIRRLNIAAVDEGDGQGDDDDESGDSDFEPLESERERLGAAMEVFEGRMQKALDAILQEEKERHAEDMEEVEEDLDNEMGAFQAGSESPVDHRGTRDTAPPSTNARRPSMPHGPAGPGFPRPSSLAPRDISSDNDGHQGEVASDREMRHNRSVRKINSRRSPLGKRGRVSHPDDAQHDGVPRGTWAFPPTKKERASLPVQIQHGGMPRGAWDSPPTKTARASLPLETQHNGTPRRTWDSLLAKRTRVSHPEDARHYEMPWDTWDSELMASTREIRGTSREDAGCEENEASEAEITTGAPDVYDLPDSPRQGKARYDISRLVEAEELVTGGAPQGRGKPAGVDSPKLSQLRRSGARQPTKLDARAEASPPVLKAGELDTRIPPAVLLSRDTSPASRRVFSAPESARAADPLTPYALKGTSKESTPSLDAPARKLVRSRVVDRKAIRREKRPAAAANKAAAGPAVRSGSR